MTARPTLRVAGDIVRGLYVAVNRPIPALVIGPLQLEAGEVVCHTPFIFVSYLVHWLLTYGQETRPPKPVTDFASLASPLSRSP